MNLFTLSGSRALAQWPLCLKWDPTIIPSAARKRSTLSYVTPEPTRTGIFTDWETSAKSSRKIIHSFIQSDVNIDLLWIIRICTDYKKNPVDSVCPCFLFRVWGKFLDLEKCKTCNITQLKRWKTSDVSVVRQRMQGWLFKRWKCIISNYHIKGKKVILRQKHKFKLLSIYVFTRNWTLNRIEEVLLTYFKRKILFHQ